MPRAAAEKVAVVAPAGTRTDAGTVRAVVRLLDRATVEPPAGAALDRVTVQLVVARTARLVLLQVRALTEIPGAPAVTEMTQFLTFPPK